MLDHIITAAPAVSIEGGRILGSVGAGGIATALTVALIAGIREPKGAAAGPGGAGGGKKSKIRKKLTSDQAQWTGVAAGTFYMAAGSIWTVGENVSDAFSTVFTGGGFGTAGTGAVSLLLASIMYFRELTPGKAAFTGIVSAGVWAQAGGIWGLPQALILTGAGAVGIL
ncbi:hypothetical protein [Streptomyces sp. AVP053U2]|uniref:hypothetical protein n=1 Tax=Streptomyces sp. AVP053U2 TaxID=1737066 RepID=UPI00073C6F5C|nr:hypothetical protein [Streptomyces sp. AVP053U2]ODA69533.1 hypothetical protein APS67_006337 [Streptomyces sp. AVP053U2]